MRIAFASFFIAKGPRKLGAPFLVANVRLLAPLADHARMRDDVLRRYFSLSPSRKAMASSSTRTASITGTTGRASKTKAGSIEQNL